MRKVVQAIPHLGSVTVVCDDGTMWNGHLEFFQDPNDGHQFIEANWTFIPGPPDGEPWRKKESKIDKIERQVREENGGLPTTN